jgi:hypothetical protein
MPLQPEVKARLENKPGTAMDSEKIYHGAAEKV